MFFICPMYMKHSNCSVCTRHRHISLDQLNFKLY